MGLLPCHLPSKCVFYGDLCFKRCGVLGTSTGECRRVVSTNGNDKSIFSLDRAFSTPLDFSSNVTIIPYVGQIAFVANTYSDGGEVQFYAQALGCVAAENKFERTGGLSAWARQAETTDGWGINFRMQFLDNVVLEGNHVWNYNTQPNPSVDPSYYPYFPGGSKTIEPWFFGSLTNDQGLGIEPGPAKPFTGGFNRFIVFRGNTVHSNGGIVVRGTSANVLVEDNLVLQSDVGIHVNYTTTQGGIVLRKNKQPTSVPANYDPYAAQYGY